MTINEHYKLHSRKSLKPYASLVVLVILIISIFQTFARFSTTSVANSSIHFAKWSIMINNQQITSGVNQLTQSINLLNVQDDTTAIDASDECYFDITINPSLTEVSISYEISLDLSAQGNTLPQGTQIKRYEKYIGNSNTPNTTNVNDETVTINGNINLPNTQIALSSSDSVRYRIYCELPEFINVQQNDVYTVIPSIMVKQKINSN